MNDELPKGWVWTSLESITDIVLGQSPPSSTYNEGEIGLPFYQGKSEFGLIYPTPTKWCSSPKKIAEKNDILISVRAPVGPTNICPEKSCIGRGLAAIRGLGNINNKFILYLLRNFEEQFRNKATGTTFEAITGNVLRNFELPLPPLAEQQRIVNKIEELFTNLDKGVESLNEVKSKLKIYRQAILKYAMKGKLTEKWREENKGKIEPASVLLEKIKEERSKVGKFKKESKFGESSLPKLPEKWEWTKLSNLFIKYQSGGTPLTKIDKYYEKGNIPFVKIEDITNSNKYLYDTKIKITEEGLNNSSAWIVPENSILYSMYASYGIPIINKIKVSTNQAVIAFVPLPELININFVYYYLLYIKPNLKNLIRGTTQENLNAQIVSNIFLTLPPLEEQNIIVERIEQLFSLAEYIEETVDSKLEESKVLRQSILKKAFEGKLVPQDPNDEPAEILLEKIKKQRLNKEKLVQEKLV